MAFFSSICLFLLVSANFMKNLHFCYSRESHSVRTPLIACSSTLLYWAALLTRSQSERHSSLPFPAKSQILAWKCGSNVLASEKHSYKLKDSCWEVLSRFLFIIIAWEPWFSCRHLCHAEKSSSDLWICSYGLFKQKLLCVYSVCTVINFSKKGYKQSLVTPHNTLDLAALYAHSCKIAKDMPHLFEFRVSVLKGFCRLLPPPPPPHPPLCQPNN